MLVNDNEDSRRTVEHCYKRSKTLINPIIDWTDADVWEFIKAENIPYCGLYDEGFRRLGCIGCPMASRKEKEIEFARWEGYKSLYLEAFSEMLEARKRKGIFDENGKMGTSPMDVFRWWLEYDILPGQLSWLEE